MNKPFAIRSDSCRFACRFEFDCVAFYTTQFNISAIVLLWKRGKLRRPSRSPIVCVANVVLAIVLFPVTAWAWGSDGHEIVAFIAADNLTHAAQSHVANILGVPADKRSVELAMEKASTIPDSRFREEDPATAPWHFIDICLQDRRQDVPARCGRRNCVTGKIEEYSRRLKAGNYDHWGAAGDLAFLIHFVGDVHQPLHAANDSDRGGNCVIVDTRSREGELHGVWDTTVVRGLEYSLDSGRPETTARRLEEKYAAERDKDSWIHADDIAWESNQIARTDIYAALQIPIEPCEPAADACINPVGRPVELSASYLDHADEIAGHQLAKAGFRLASLLNGIWTAPIASEGAPVTNEKNSAETVSSNQSEGIIVGNRRSKIYAWPGCGSYDRMAPQNRVVFTSREAAEQAGYRAALNCP
jgi:nuclease S1